MPAILCAALGLLLRILYLSSASENPFWRHLGLDMAGYDRWARAVLAGQGLGESPFTQAPLFPLLLSMAYAVLGPDPVRALWFQLLPGILLVFLVAYAAGRWKGPAAAWGAGLLAAVYKPAIFYTGVLLPPAWVAALAALALASTLSLRRRIVRSALPPPAEGNSGTGMGRGFFLPAAGTGMTFGVLGLGQPSALAAFLPAAWWLLRGSKGTAGAAGPFGSSGSSGSSGSFRAPAAGRGSGAGPAPPPGLAAGLAAGVALPLLLTLLYNGIGGGAWSPVAVNGGINLYIGNGPEANGAYVRPPGMREDRDLLGIAAARAALSSGGIRDASAAQANSFWTRRALRYGIAHPLRTAGLYLRKLLFFFGQYEVPQVESMPFERRYSRLLRLPLPGMALAVGLGLLGALLLVRRDSAARWLAGSAAAVALGVSIFFVTARFRVVALPFLAVLAGGGIAELRRRAASGQPAGERRRLLLPLALFVAAWGALSLNLTGIDARVSEGQYHFRLGVILEKDQRTEEAAGEYRQALELDPSLGKAEVNLGTLLARRGRQDEARSHLERGISLDPLSAVGFLNLGQLDQLQGRPGEALAAYRRALDLDPSLGSARESAAMLLYESGRCEEARAELERVVQGAPPGSPPYLRAGSLLQILTERASLSDASWRGSGTLLQADLRLIQGDHAGAVRLYNEAMLQPEAREAARRMLRRLSPAAESGP